MKLFVTGATGFIGSHFVKQALAAGHTVRALRRSPESRPRMAINPEWIQKGMDELERDDFAGCDALIHLAAHTANVPYDTLENCLHWNLTVPLHMFGIANDAGIDRFVVAGSCFEYGRSAERFEFIPPTAPLEPTASYPASKAAASVAFHAYAVEANVKLSIHRIFQVYGEGESESRFWPSLKKAALAGEDFPMSKGEQVRDFIPVEQVAKSLLFASTEMLVERGIPTVRNVGTGCPMTLKQFAEQCWEKFGAEGNLEFGIIPYRDNEVMRYIPLISSNGPDH